MEVTRLGVKLELRLLAYSIAIATQDPSRIFELHHSSQQRQILDPLMEARDRMHNLMDTSRIHFWCTSMGTPTTFIFLRNHQTFPQQLHHFIPSSNVQGFQFLHILVNTCYFLFFVCFSVIAVLVGVM